MACLEADWHVHTHGIPLAWLRIAPTPIPMPKSSASLADLLENWLKLCQNMREETVERNEASL